MIPLSSLGIPVQLASCASTSCINLGVSSGLQKGWRIGGLDQKVTGQLETLKGSALGGGEVGVGGVR